MKYRHGPSIDYNELQELRKGMELQFRYKFYKDPKFPFLQSMGIKHIIQGFDAGDDVGFIGTLHLWWESDPTGTVSAPEGFSRDSVATGVWESEWIDTPAEALALAVSIRQNKNYDEEKLMMGHMKEIQKIAELEAMRQLREKARDEATKESENVLWN
jgi:hypothetical protein